MTTETDRARAQVMEAHKHALTEAALGHERVVEFLTKIDQLLAHLGRGDIEVIQKAHLERDGVVIRVMVAYDTLFPRHGESNRLEVARMRQAEVAFLDALEQAGIKIKTGMVIGTGNSTDRTHLTIFNGIVDYLGVFSEEE